MKSSMLGMDVYIEVKDKKGSLTVDMRRAWNPSLLLDNLRKQYFKEGSTVREISRQEYLKAQQP